MVVRLVSEVIFVLNGSFSFKICMYDGKVMLLLYLFLGSDVGDTPRQ